jgi:hypothetical protein
MLFKMLKLLGLDIPAKIEAVKASLELRVEQATDRVEQAAQKAAVIAAFSAIAAITAMMAAGVGLIAVYRWTADAYGAYAGLGVVGAALVVVTVIFATAATIKVKSLTANRIVMPRHAAGTAGMTSGPDVVMSEPVNAQSQVPPGTATPAASDLVEPLAFLLSKLVKYPSTGDPVVDDLMGNLRTTARGAADEAVAGAADVIRHGDRTNLVVVLAGAVFAGWLLTHHSRQLSLKS